MKTLAPIQYKTIVRRPSTTFTREGAIKVKAPVSTPGIINGIQAGSSYEWNIALALWQLGWSFDYQVPIKGGRQVRGCQVIDFLVHTVPQETALRVQGSYWHRNNALEEYKADDISHYLGMPVTVLDAFNENAATYNDAHAFIFQHFGRA